MKHAERQRFSSLKKECRRGRALPGLRGQPASRQGRHWNQALISLGKGRERFPLFRRKQALFSVANGKPNRGFRRVPLWPFSQEYKPIRGTKFFLQWKIRQKICYELSFVLLNEEGVKEYARAISGKGFYGRGGSQKSS